VDGFRFDLMSVLDTGTIQAAYTAVRAVNPHALFLGEGWQGFYSGASVDYQGSAIAGCDQTQAARFKGEDVGMFSDSYRQVFKNGYPQDGSPAFLTGQAESGASLFSNVAGVPSNSFAPGSADNVVDYFTCHDNLCYYDVLAMATDSAAGAAGDAAILRRAKVGYAILLTSQGTAFLHAGDEMFRSKATTASSGAANSLTAGNGRVFVDNSYNASDAVNMVRWDTVYAADPLANGFTDYATGQDGCQLYLYTQGLIALRKSSNAFRLPDADAGNVTSLPAAQAGSSTLAFGYQCVAADGTGTYLVFHNADTASHSFTVGQSLAAASLLVDGASAGLTPITASSTASLSPDGKTVTLAPLSSAVFKL
jgi:pullulanase/glycogen debranching enzyme